MITVSAPLLDTLAFAGIGEAEVRARAVAARAGCDLWEDADCFVRRRVAVGPPGAATLVFIADGPATVESYDGLIDTLSGRFTIIVVELPGFGFSYAKRAEALTFEGSCQAIADALLDTGLDRMILVGPCVGGLVAAAVAPRLGDRLAGLIIAQTGDFAAERSWVGRTIDRDGSLRQAFTGQIAFRLQRERASIDWWSAFACGPGLDLPAFQRTARDVLQAGSCMALASQLQLWLDEDLPTVMPPAVPTAIVWGLADRSHAETDRASTRTIAPHAAFHECPDTGHFVDLENPELIARIATELLSD